LSVQVATAAADAVAPDSAGPPAVRAIGLNQAYGERVVYRDVGFSVARGEVFAVLGASGCGKTNLMKQLVGLLPANGGRVELLGHDLAAGAAEMRRMFGVMFQSGALFGSLSLLENVMLPLQMYSDLPAEGRAMVARVKLGLVGLGDAASRMPAEISGGMAKRAAIARALALDPPLLFLDEPSAGLDPVTSAGLDRLILDLRRDLGTTFVVVTHELDSILAIADRCIMLDRAAQGIVAEGDPRRLRQESRLPIVHAFFHREAT
jgi:phospholipid/cholesterol/gamma-HCH transport system ATP-binding protein